MTEDEIEIRELISRETTAFLMRDFEGWSACWLHDDSVRRLGALAGGVTDYSQGWAAGADQVARMFARFPTPNPEAAAGIERSDMVVRRTPAMAWVSFDQFGERSDDPFVAVGTSHQIRVCEKVGRVWKIAMAGHADTDVAYIDYPIIRLGAGRQIEWMSAAAEAELPTHPALTSSNGTLRGRHPADEARLGAALADMLDLTVLERRASIPSPRGRNAKPVSLDGDLPDGQHIVWVSMIDGKIHVSFRDLRNEAARLDHAAEVFDLSPAQVKVTALILSGHDMPQIAERLGIAANTARTHLSRIFDKTGARTQAAVVSRVLGLDPP